jgi:hypothetical protein
MANENNLKPFKKGIDNRRNVKGRPAILPELKEAIAKLLSEDKEGKTALDKILNVLYDRAMKGDIRAIQELLDRGFGKPTNKIEHSKDINFDEATITKI